MENKMIYEVGFHWSYYAEFSDNCGDSAQRFFEQESKAEIYFDELNKNFKKGMYSHADYVYIKKYELNVDNDSPMIKISKE